MKHWRQYLSSAAVMVGVFMLAAFAFAAPSTLTSNHSDDQGDDHGKPAVTATVTDDNETEAPDTEKPDATETASDDSNHGHCVSWVAHQSKDDGYKGSDRGSIVSAVAQQDVTSTKDEASDECKAAYDGARASFSTSTVEEHGKEPSDSESSETHGKGGSHGSEESSEHEPGS